ncbi:flavodoxin family protein [Aquitalea sp. S1-19]|nr:flavodoxin family protein [Aquitalea sp. S1-19]
MPKLAIVYHSGYGHTAKLAEAVAAGAASVAGIDLALLALDAQGELSDEAWTRLDGMDGIIFGSPTYMGGASWQFKKFADTSSRRWFGQVWKDKLAAGFTNSASVNGDKHSTLHYFITLAMQHGMLWVGSGMLPSNSKAAQRNDINWLGSYAGAIAQSPSDASPDEGPLPGDLATGHQFGIRVANALLRWHAA